MSHFLSLMASTSTASLQKQQTKVLWQKIAFPFFKRWIWFCLVLGLGLGSLFGIEHLLRSVEKNLYQQARDLLGADLSLSSWQAFDETWEKKLVSSMQSEGFIHSKTLELATMAKLKEGAPFLISLKAVNQAYPLRGKLQLKDIAQAQSPLIKAGEAWISLGLSEQKKLKLGDELQIDHQSFKISGIIEKEPDSSFTGALSFAPRVMIHSEDLAKTRLITLGSRIKYKLLFALKDERPDAEAKVNEQRVLLSQSVLPSIEVESYLNAQPNSLRLFERIALFFSMVALVSLTLCLSAFFISLFTFIQEQQAMLSVLRALGISHQTLMRFYLQFSALIGLLSGIIGVVLGSGLSYLLSIYAQPYFNVALPFQVNPIPSLLLIAASIIVSLLMMRLLLNALNQSSVQEQWGNINLSLKLSLIDKVMLVITVSSFIVLYLYLSSGSLFLAIAFLLGFACLMGLAYSLLFLFFKVLASFKKTKLFELTLGHSMQFALNHFLGYQNKNKLVLLSLSIGFTMICSLEFVSYLFQKNLSLDDAQSPQFFMIDIQPDQEAGVQALAEEFQLQGLRLNTLVRARLSAIQGNRIQFSTLAQDTPATRLRARTLTREYNLSARDQLNVDESVVQGQWWDQLNAEAIQNPCSSVSIEERFAKGLDLKIGDQISFDIQGREIESTIVNFRRVNWLSFAPNFLILYPKACLEKAPRTAIAASRFAGDPAIQLERFSTQLFDRFSNISLIDLRAVFAEGKKLLTALSSALSLTGLLCALSGALILLSTMLLDRKNKEAASMLLWTLGVNAKQATRWILWELLLMSLFQLLTIGILSLLFTWICVYYLDLTWYFDMAHFFIWIVLASLLPLLSHLFFSLKRSS
jgi:putative ABC transport system permease protein